MPVQTTSQPDLEALTPRRVCLIKPSALGDVTNAFATLSALRRRWPEATITWVVNASLRGLVEGHPEIDQVIQYDRAGIKPNPSGVRKFWAFLRSLRSERFDLAIDLQGLLRSGLMTAATGAPVRVGLADAREGASWFYTNRVVPPGSHDEAHAVDRMLAVAAAFGADVGCPTFTVAVDSSAADWARSIMADLPRPRLAVNLGARWETKRWPPEHFAELARRASATRGARLVALGAPEDRPFVEEFIRRVDPIPVLDLCGRLTLPTLAAVCREVDVVLSNDTGPLHLASAAGVRVVGVYTCTSPALNGPYGPRALAVQTGVWCKGSYRVTCGRLECMAELTPDRVWPLVESQLDASARSANSAA
ncbi:MAG: glycosyltransferase family 9 protein [Isosphaeraceae bacterium]